MKYSVVIPTYNHCDDLLRPCIDSILKYTDITTIELIVSANGCVDNTFEYLGQLKARYNNLGLSENFKIVWNNEPLGYSRACNAGIEVATTDLIVLLNNDTILLEQHQNRWLAQLEMPFVQNQKCGISCLIKSESEPAGHDFAIFFCVMIHRKVFDKIGLLSLDYGAGGGEDTEFSIECERAGFEVLECVQKAWNGSVGMYSGDFPIYHKGEGTVHDKNLVPEWDDIFLTNSLTLARKYNPRWYQWRLSNNAERAVFFKGDPVFPREVARYQFAANNMSGKKILELGCSSGFGLQFFPKDIEYTGIDYDKHVIKAAEEQNWGYNAKFIHADINNIELEFYDTIIAFETIEHIINGLDIVERFKNHCNTLIITVPYNENPGTFSPHHLIHNITEKNFENFDIKFINLNGNIVDNVSVYNNPQEHDLLLGIWKRNVDVKPIDIKPVVVKPTVDLAFMAIQDPLIYKEVILSNQYNVSEQELSGRTVIDVGANIGCFTLLAAKLKAMLVIGVEPVKKTHDTLKQNITTSQFKNIIALKNVVTDKQGVDHKISFQNENSGANSLYNVNENYELVQSITLETLLKLSYGDDIFLKLDCEGAEYDIIMNATKDSMKRIKTLVMEVHSDLHPVYKGREILANKLIELGFKNTKYDPVYYFVYDNNGTVLSVTNLPYSNERWERCE